MKTRGLALIVVIGILGVLAVLAAAFVMMAQMERRASEQRVNAARAYLLARSGMEDAFARLDLGQDPAYGGENWDGSADGLLSAFEAQQEVYQRGTANVEDCPVRHAMRPSFFARFSQSPDPDLLAVDSRERGYSGKLAGDHADRGNTYALKVSSSNAGIHINGGALDAEDRDPDGPGTPPEAAPLLPNKVPDHRDASMEGPNGFLVRLLNNLDAVMTNGATSNLGVQVVGARPVGGYKSLDELKPVLGQARYDQFKPTLTLRAWVDPKVVKPQPMDGRPQRWEDIDDAHRIGTEAEEISGVHRDPTVDTFKDSSNTWTSGVAPPRTGMRLSLEPGVQGQGRPNDPWVHRITATNGREGTVTYPVLWERNFIYAWSQLQPSPIPLEPRAPLAVNLAPKEVLASAFAGLKGTSLEVWDGAGGWDGGFGFFAADLPVKVTIEEYPYPSEATEETPWHRTRVDYGSTCGTGSRPWYGPADYAPHAPPHVLPWPQGSTGNGGKPVVQAAPLGRLRESEAISRSQAGAIAELLIRHRPVRTWSRFNAFVDALPRWEDVNDDGILDGKPYTVEGSGGIYLRRQYLREDLNSDGLMQREIFAEGLAGWQDAGFAPGQGKADLGPGKVPGLTFVQRDVLKAMANPNTDLNDFNPDANLWKEVDKMDVAGIGTSNRAPPGEGYRPYDPAPDADAYIHTTELALDDQASFAVVRALGRVLGSGGRLLAQRQLGAVLSAGEVYRDTTQADFMRGLMQGQPVVSYPEPPGATPEVHDGQLSLRFVSALPRPDTEETLRGELFGSVDAEGTGDRSVADLRGPPALFSDGVYSERDRTLMFPVEGNIFEKFYVACWVKPNWFPEASPRPHALLSLSHWDGQPQEPGDRRNPFGVPQGRVPIDDILARPVGLYFVPARNNVQESGMGLYVHDAVSTRGSVWPRRALLWGMAHALFATDCLNRRGIERPLLSKPMGRFESHRWHHIALVAKRYDSSLLTTVVETKVILGRRLGSVHGGGWDHGFREVKTVHRDGTPNHLRFGEVAAHPSMNYTADATFANVRAGVSVPTNLTEPFFMGPFGPAGLGRYLREDGASYISPLLPSGARPQRVTWTEIPCDLWFDQDADGWLGDVATGHKPLNDRFGSSLLGLPVSLPNGKRDVRIDLEVWDDLGTADPSDDVKLARFDNPAADNRIPQPSGRLYYKAIFVNEWDADTRANHPLDVTPFLDDVTLTYMEAGGPRIVHYEATQM